MEWLITLTHPIKLYENATLTVSFVLSSTAYLIICFVLLGVTASDYLCPNVASVAEPGTLRSVAHSGSVSSGALVAILLSWCNSAPDLFSNLLSWTSSRTSMAVDTESESAVISNSTAAAAAAAAAAALSVGEVIGSCGVILCVVQGAIFMLMGTTSDPIRLNRRQQADMLRDTGFVFVAMLLLTYISLNNRVSVMNCLVMISWYGVYIFTKFKQHNRSSVTNEFDETVNFGEAGTGEFNSNNSNNSNNANTSNNTFIGLPETVIKPSIIEAMDYTTLLNLLEHSSDNDYEYGDSDERIDNGFIGVKNRVPSFSLVLLDHTTSENLTTKQNQQSRKIPRSAPVVNEAFGAYSDDTRLVASSPAAVSFTPYSDNPESETSQNLSSVQQEQQQQQKQRQVVSLFSPFAVPPRERIHLAKVLIKMFIPHMANYKHKSVPDWILSLVTVPFVIILQISCPKPIKLPLDYERNSPKYNYTILNIWILMAQSLVAPTITLLLISCLHQSSSKYTKLYIYWLLPSLLLLVSLPLLTTLVYLLQRIHKYNRFVLPRRLTNINSTTISEYDNDETDAKLETRRRIESATTIIGTTIPLLGIVNSILYISLIANALVETLELYQRLTEVSEAILGLTVFAWGNSISDLISNVAMCRLYRRFPLKNSHSYSESETGAAGGGGGGSGELLLASKFFVIACSSCVGGVMLNSTVGIGLSGLVAMLFVHCNNNDKNNNKWWFLRYTDLYLHETLAIDYKFIVSCCGIGVVVLVMAVSYGLGGHYFKWIDEKRWAFGAFMCMVWGIVTICNVCLETFLK